MISQASLRNLARKFLRVCGPPVSASRVSFSAVSFPFHVFPCTLPSTESHTTADKPNGAFSEYLVTDAELQAVPIPGGWSFEEAAQLGVSPLTALQCLHESLELPSPFETRPTAEQPQILIWGGSSALGQYSITATRVSWRRFARRLVMRLTLPLMRSRRVRRLRRSLAQLETRVEKSLPSFPTRVPVRLLKLPSACLITCSDVYDYSNATYPFCVWLILFLGSKRQMVRRSIETDPLYGKDQACPCSHTTQRTCWSEGRSEVHAGRKGKFDAYYRSVR